METWKVSAFEDVANTEFLGLLLVKMDHILVSSVHYQKKVWRAVCQFSITALRLQESLSGTIKVYLGIILLAV